MPGVKARVKIDDEAWKRTLKNIEDNAKQLKGKPYVDVGVLGGTEPDGKSTVLVASAMEYGVPSKNIPSRSFIRSTVFEGRSKINDLIKTLQRDVIMMGNVKRALGIVGEFVTAMTKDKIEKQDPNWAKLSDATLKRKQGKGSTGEGKPGEAGGVKTLIDSGQMLRSITYKVEGGE